MSWTWGSRIKRKNKQDRSLFITEDENAFPISTSSPVSISYRYIGVGSSSFVSNNDTFEDSKNPLDEKKTKDWEKVWGEKRRAIDLE